jgi:cell division protein FtsB
MIERRNSWLRQSLVSLLCLAALGYFLFHASSGKHGLGARARLVERSNLLEPEIARLETARAQLERDVGLLRDASPDRDLVEELALDILGQARPGDRVVVTP